MATHHRAGKQYRLALWANRFADRHPKSYLGVALLLTLPGYAFLLLFPYLVVEGATVLAREIPNARTTEHWIVVEVWSAILLFCLLLSNQVFRLHFPRACGLKLSKDLAPELFRLIGEMKSYTAKLSIRNVILTDRHELRIEQTPRLGYPFACSNTLIIGMPLLQTLSEAQFRGELLRHMVQYSSGALRPVHWLFRTRRLWRRYADALASRSRLAEAPMRWFFSLYAPLFEVLTLPAARRDELAADSAVLEWLNDRDYFQTVKSRILAERFLNTQFWRKVHKHALQHPQKVMHPFAELERITGQPQPLAVRQQCLQAAFEEQQDVTNAMPVLHQRMDNIGQDKLREVPVVEKTAAEACLGEARGDFISILDKLWRSTTFMHWKADYEQRCADLHRAKTLSRKSRQQVLGVREIVLYARLARQLRGDSLRNSLAKMGRRSAGHLLSGLTSGSALARKVRATQDTNVVN